MRFIRLALILISISILIKQLNNLKRAAIKVKVRIAVNLLRPKRVKR